MQIDTNTNFIAWTDQLPAENLYNNDTWYPDGAHSKGFLAYNSTSDKGIYVVHSFPKWPGVNA